MFVISLNYRTVPEDLLKKLTMSDEDAVEFMKHLRKNKISECVYMAADNRVEIYGRGDYRTAVRLLVKDTAVEESLLCDHLLIYLGEEALWHLLSVTSGLEWMRPGDDEVMGQVKRAYFLAQSSGFLGEEFPQIFQTAIAAARKVKAAVPSSGMSGSILSLVMEYCRRSMSGHTNILILGEDERKLGNLQRAFLSGDDCDIMTTMDETGSRDGRIHIIEYEHRYLAAVEADIIISATNRPQYTLTARHLEALTPKKRLFIDLSTPRDLDDAIADLPRTTLLTMEELEKNAKEEKVEASPMDLWQGILEEAMDDYLKENLFQKFMPRMERLTSRHTGGIDHFIFDYKEEASAKELQALIDVLDRMGQS